MKTLTAKTYVEWMMNRAERVFFVYGMRRSGNHACIGWLINGLEGQAVSLHESEHRNNFNFSDSGRTVFINDVSGMSNRLYLWFLHKHIRYLRRAQFIIISAEDRDATYGNGWRIPRRSETILAQRGTLNLMASRYQNLNRRAREGLGANLQSMKAKFFATLKANIETPQGLVWEFERWSNDEAWRRDFLESLGLSDDIAPPVSPPGLGSSFSGTQARPSADQLSKRFMTVEPRTAWISFIQTAASEHPEIFRAEEHEAIHAMSDR